jgi:hypothetical protein
LGGKPSIEILPNQKRKFVGINDTFHEKKKVSSFKPVKRRELVKMLLKSVSNTKIYNYQEVKADFELIWKILNVWYSKQLKPLEFYY